MTWLLVATVFAGVMTGEVVVEIFAETSATSFMEASNNWFWAFPNDPATSDAALAAKNTLAEDEYLTQLCGPVTPLK